MKYLLYVCAACTLLFAAPAAMAGPNDPIKEKVAGLTKEQVDARIVEMKQRVQEIKKMDKSSLSKAEKKELRQELRDMNKEAKAMNAQGVYLSVGAIIIIILLLILIL